MAKRDYYEVLDVAKNATDEEIKKHIVRKLYSITRIRTPAIRKLKRSLKKQPRLMKY